MTPLLEYFTTVAAGAWNPGVFTPEWVKSHLIETDRADLELALEPSGPVYRVIADGLIVIPKRSQLVIGAHSSTKKWYESLTTMAKALELLPHTPISAIGVNFGFLCSQPAPKLEALFQFSDAADLARFGATADKGQLRRSLTLSADIQMQLLISEQSNAQYAIHSNIHFEATAAPAMIEWARDPSRADLLNQTTFLLKSVYDVEITNEHLEL